MSKEVLFELKGMKIVDIKSDENVEYIGGSCPTCGGDFYYTNSLFLVTSDGEEVELKLCVTDYMNIKPPSMSFLVKYFHNMQDELEKMSIDDLEEHLINTITMYDDLVDSKGVYGTWMFIQSSYEKFLEFINRSYENYFTTDTYEYPKYLYDEFLEAAEHYYYYV